MENADCPSYEALRMVSLNDATCQKLAKQHHERLFALKDTSHLVQFLDRCTAHCPGLTMQAFQPAADCATDTLMGNTELLYAVGADAQGEACSVVIQPTGVNAALVAPYAPASTLPGSDAPLRG